MFTIDSNILGVLRQTEDLIERRIPKALVDALQPELWYRDARDLAVRIMLTLAQPSERKYITDFADTVTASLFGQDGLSLQMHTPFPELVNLLTQAQSARAAMSSRDLMQNLFAMPVQEFEELIKEWVETEKRKDSRDAGKSDEEIAHLISYILISPRLTPGGRGEKARAALMPHIAEFLQRKQAMSRLSPETVDQWLRAVLNGWRELVRVKYAEKVRAQLALEEGSLL